MGDPSDRVSDAERDQTVVSLRGDLLAGRLTLDEFSERVDVAYRARIGAELVRAREGLPETQFELASSRRNPTRLTAALFGHVTRRGRLRLRRQTLAACAFGDLDLDLREAEIDDPQTVVTVLAAFGNLDLYVPEGVNVEASGTILFGHRREWGRDLARADAPTVHVRTLGCFATVDVWRVPHHMHGSYDEIFRQLQSEHEQQQHQP